MYVVSNVSDEKVARKFFNVRFVRHIVVIKRSYKGKIINVNLFEGQRCTINISFNKVFLAKYSMATNGLPRSWPPDSGLTRHNPAFMMDEEPVINFAKHFSI